MAPPLSIRPRRHPPCSARGDRRAPWCRLAYPPPRDRETVHPAGVRRVAFRFRPWWRTMSDMSERRVRRRLRLAGAVAGAVVLAGVAAGVALPRLLADD